MTIRLAVVGASGRMGRAVVRLAREDAGFALVAAVGRDALGVDAGELAGGGRLGVAVTSELPGAARPEVVVDFSAAAALPEVARAAAVAGAALVSGTTGLDAEGERALEETARRVPVLWEPNMSIGVHVLGALVAQAVAMLGPGFDVEVVEAHHRAKVDAPSGTALRLVEIARRARGDDARLAHGREGRPGARPVAEIGVHAVRGGDVIGDHAVHLLGDGERIEIAHRASSRELFARGALRAAAWIAGRAPGRYGLSDVLGAPRRGPSA